jgi:hypothetical protein
MCSRQQCRQLQKPQPTSKPGRCVHCVLVAVCLLRCMMACVSVGRGAWEVTCKRAGRWHTSLLHFDVVCCALCVSLFVCVVWPQAWRCLFVLCGHRLGVVCVVWPQACVVWPQAWRCLCCMATGVCCMATGLALFVLYGHRRVLYGHRLGVVDAFCR